MTDAPRTLIADDQPDVLEALRLLLKREGFQIESASSPGAVLDKLRTRDFDLLLMDLNYALDTTSGREGLDLLTRVQNLDSALPVVVMTAWGSVPLAVEAMRRGARDFVEKPWENTQLLATLRAQIAGRAARYNEAEDAAAVQRQLLPRHIPSAPGCDVALMWRPAQAVGGDYVDVLAPGTQRIGFAVADAIGKGMSAALLMANVQAAVRVLACEQLPPDQLTARLNRTLCGNLRSGKFVTFFYAEMNGRRLSYCNAGHPPPVLIRADGTVCRLDEGGAVLGVFTDSGYRRGEVRLQAGDRLALFTDGITEAHRAGTDFGEQSLIDVLSANRHMGAHALENHVMRALAGYTLDDDATLLIVAC